MSEKETGDTFVLYPAVAQPQARKLTAGAEVRLVQELRMARLGQHYKVAVVVRDDDGVYKLRPAVSAAEHWVRDENDGRVNEKTFVEALALQALPWHVKFRRDNEDDLGTLRLAEC
jgi:hypothetical protein